MNLLIVSQHFYPDVFRINEIARALTEGGHHVSVLTGLPDYQTGRISKDYRFFRKRRENWHGVHIVRVPVVARRRGLLFRGLNYLSFLFFSLLYVRFCKKQSFDAVFCYQTSPVTMAHAGMVYAKRLGKEPFLYCLDLWPESLKTWHIQESSMLYRLMHRYAGRLYRNCGRIAVTSRPFLRYLREVNGVQEERLCHLPQHARALSLPQKPFPQPGEEIHLVFAGNMGEVQDIPCILDTAALLKDLPQLHFDLYGEGSERQNGMDYAQNLGLTQTVHFYGHVDMDTLAQCYGDADAFLLTLKAVGWIGQTLPGKLQEYLSGGRPVFAAAEGASATVIKEADCGVCVPPSDAKALADALRDFVQNPAKYRECGPNGLQYYRDHYTLERFLDTLLEEIRRMRENRTTGMGG